MFFFFSSSTSDRSGGGSSSIPSPELANEVFSKNNNEQEFFNSDLPLDFSDVDMEHCFSSKTDSPFQIDLSSLFTQSTYDAVQPLSNSDVFGNDFSSSKPSSGYDACCESSAESTTSREGVVALDMENLSTKKSEQTVKDSLPNFTPLVLTGRICNILSLFRCSRRIFPRQDY